MSESPPARSISPSYASTSSLRSPPLSSRKRKTPPHEYNDLPQLPPLKPVYRSSPPAPVYHQQPSAGHRADTHTQYTMAPQHEIDQPPSPTPTASGRQLSTSKRAEQNRKAQRAFRERRDQHVKQLEARAQLVDAALASADEANRRWEECRTLVEQLRAENSALRAALGAVSAARAAIPSFTAPAVSEILNADPPGSADRLREKEKERERARESSRDTQPAATVVS